MKRSRTVLILLLSLLTLLSVSASFAQVVAVPQMMNFQGRLARPDGTPVADGTYSIRFSLHSALSSGTETWNQTVGSVIVKSGTFAVQLSGFPANTFHSNQFLQIKIGTDAPLTPRQPLVTTPYAFKADMALTVPDGSITNAKIAAGTLTADKFADNIFNPLAWLLGGNSGVTSGFLGTTDNQPLVLKVNNRRAMQYQYAENANFRTMNLLGGSEINEIGAGVLGATIAGGGADSFTGTDSPNRVLADFGTVGGGQRNTVSGYSATVGGGDRNTASGLYATVGGGFSNTASGSLATVGGGDQNTASGISATVGGGYQNTASGNLSFAAGFLAKANHDGAFVWADNSSSNFASTAANQFLIRASGGVGINTNNPQVTLHVNGNVRADGGEYQSWGPIALHPDTDNSGDDVVQFLNSAGGETMRIHSNGNVGIGTNSPGAPLEVRGGTGPTSLQILPGNLNGVPTADTATLEIPGNGTIGIWDNLRVQGSVSGVGNYINISDARYKQHIAAFPDALDTILNLRGVTFDWNQQEFPDMNFTAGKQIGFIAQEVEKVLPELVTTDAKGYKAVAYANVVPVLVEAVKTQQKQITDLRKSKETELNELKAKNADLEARLERIETTLRLKAGGRD